MTRVDPEFAKEPYFADFIEWEGDVSYEIVDKYGRKIEHLKFIDGGEFTYPAQRRMTMITPDITHYHGREVEAVQTKDGTWQIVLEGDVKIISYSPDYEAPPDVLVGLTFTKTVLSPMLTKLYFGNSDNPFAAVVNFPATQYGLSDPSYQAGEVVRPQAGYVTEAPVSAEDAEEGSE